MKTSRILFLLLLLLAAGTLKSDSQVITIKKWTGTYPDMNGSYPLSFIAVKGLLLPEVHVFVRSWPTHYYIDAISVPVTDAVAIAEDAANGILRIATRILERSYMKSRYSKTGEIKSNRSTEEEINRILFNAKSDTLEDYYGLTAGFVELYAKLDDLEALEKGDEVRSLYEDEADDLFVRFLSISEMKTGHGEKLATAGDIFREQQQLMGEVDYTAGKMKFFSSFNEIPVHSYSFLTH